MAVAAAVKADVCEIYTDVAGAIPPIRAFARMRANWRISTTKCWSWQQRPGAADPFGQFARPTVPVHAGSRMSPNGWQEDSVWKMCCDDARPQRSENHVAPRPRPPQSGRQILTPTRTRLSL
jgi:hypothetical protein